MLLCRQALACGLQRSPHNPSIFARSSCTHSQTDCQTVRVRAVQGAMQSRQAGRQAVARSFLSCLQRHYSKDKSCSCPSSCSLFVAVCSLVVFGCGVGAAGLQRLSCERTDSGRIQTAHLARLLARSLITVTLTFRPLSPAPFRPLRISEREGPAPRSACCRRSLPANPAGRAQPACSRPRHCLPRREARGLFIVCSGPGRDPLPYDYPLTRCTHNQTTTTRKETRASWGGAKTGSPDWKSRPLHVIREALYKYCRSGTGSILPPSSNRAHDSLALGLCNLARRWWLNPLGNQFVSWTPKRSLHTHLYDRTVHISAAHAPTNLEVVPHTVQPLDHPRTPCEPLSSLRVSKALHVYESKRRTTTS